MKNTIYMSLLMLPLCLSAQKHEGTIEYQETVKFEIELPEDMQQYASHIPNEQKTNMVLTFNEKASLYKLSDKKDKVETADDSDEVQIQVHAISIGGGESAVTYCDLSSKKGLTALDVMGKKFLVSFDAGSSPWKVKDEQREILGYQCIKAIAETEEGLVTAWYTPEISLSIGPDSYSGLPGAILALEISGEEDNRSIAATEVLLAPLKKDIRRPSKGEAVTEDEFEKIIQKRVEAMREMNGGGEGNVIIRRESVSD